MNLQILTFALRGNLGTVRAAQSTLSDHEQDSAAP